MPGGDSAPLGRHGAQHAQHPSTSMLQPAGVEERAVELLPMHTCVTVPRRPSDPVASRAVPTADKDPQARSSVAGASFNFINSIIGAGIIGLPYALHHTGFFVGIVMLLGVAMTADFTVRLLVRCGLHVGKHDYEDLCEHVMGKPGFYFVSTFMFLFAYGAMVAYFVIIGDTAPKAVAQLVGDTSPLANRELVLVLCATLVVLPLCMLKDLARLAWASTLSVLAVFMIIATVIARAPSAVEAAPAASPAAHELRFVRPTTLFSGLSAMSFAFVCHHNTFLVYNSLSDRSEGAWRRVTRISITTAFLASLTLSLVGYLTFFGAVEGDVLNNFADDDVAVNVARLLLALTMVLTFPMEQFVTRHALDAMLFRDQGPTTPLRYYSLTLLLWGSSLLLGLFLTKLGPVLELAGAVSASMLGYVLPVMCYYRVHSFRGEMEKLRGAWQRHSEHYQPALLDRLRVSAFQLTLLGVALFGVLCLTFGTAGVFT